MNRPPATHAAPAQTLATPDELKGSLRRLRQLKGRQPDPDTLERLRALLLAHGHDKLQRDRLIEYLHVVNDEWRHLPEGWLVALARLMNIPMTEVFEVASFYHHFEIDSDKSSNDARKGPIKVRICDGWACAMAGAGALHAEAQRLERSGEVVVEHAPCIGRCEQAPACSVHQHAFGPATADHIEAVLNEQRIDARAPVHYTDFDAYRAAGGYALPAAIAEGKVSVESVIAKLEQSGLRGLGGAGFPAGRKWRIVRDQPAPRVMAVNIDEGEPGTFKDRYYLERDPHRFLEGVLVAAMAVGIEACYIYLRDEYHDCRVMLQAELARLQAAPPCPLPRIELRRGAGAYICGEESAMIESIEGKRGEPRMRPPYIAQVGLFGRPTLEHNFETLYWVRDLTEKGVAWFTSEGRHGRKGLRSFSVSGRVKNPGVKLAPAGITIQELIDEHCGGMQDGHRFYAYLPGGASGGILPARLNQIPLDFDTLQPYGCFIGSAAVMVLSQHDRARDAALNMMRFFADESCGQCTPCRVGTVKAAELMDAARWDLATLEDLAQVMGDASICGLGQAAPNPIRTIVKYFPQEVA